MYHNRNHTYNHTPIDFTLSYNEFVDSFQGWSACAKWANSYNLTIKLIEKLKF